MGRTTTCTGDNEKQRPSCNSPSAVTTFFTVSRARLRHASAGRARALGSRAADAKCRKTNAWGSASVTTWSSAGNDGGLLCAPGRRSAAPCRALPRGSALGAPSTPGDWPRFPEYVVARRHAVSGTAPSRSVRVARPTVPRIHLPFKITVKGAPSARRCSAPQTLEQ